MHRLVEAVEPLHFLERFGGISVPQPTIAAATGPASPAIAILYAMIWRSIGPPGTKCITTNTTIVMPMNVGMISSNRG